MEYPAHALYEVLYARYLKPGRTQELLAHCGSLQGARVLDLCGGGGRASLTALQMGAEAVTLVDESVPMTQHLSDTCRIEIVQASIEAALASPLSGGPFDAAVCQQAVTYWFNAQCVKALRSQLRRGARFVFNTFWDEPARFPTPKQYEYEGRKYLELSWLSDARTVEHVQVCEGYPPHTTRFQWVTPDEFRAALEPHFSVEEIRDGKTSVYVCVAQ